MVQILPEDGSPDPDPVPEHIVARLEDRLDRLGTRLGTAINELQILKGIVVGIRRELMVYQRMHEEAYGYLEDLARDVAVLQQLGN